MSELFKSAMGYFGPSNGAGQPENDQNVGEIVKLSNRNIRILKLIAEGGFSYVFQGQDLKTGEFLALKKILASDGASMKKIEEEINFMKNLTHVNIVKFYGSTRSGNEFMLVMEHCRTTLPQLPLSFKHVGQVFGQTCRAVEYLHCFGIAHRDIKVENVLIGEDSLVKLVDFGSATLEKIIPSEDWSATKRNILEEDIAKETTPMYRSPEMLDLWSNFPIDERGDMWALGCFLFALCYKNHPFQESNKLAIINANYVIPKNDTTYTPYATIIKGLLQIDPRDRMNFNTVFEILSSIGESNGFSLNDPLPFRPARPAIPPQPIQPVEKSSGGPSLLTSIRGGAESLFKNLKESSQKYIGAVPGSEYPQRPERPERPERAERNERPELVRDERFGPPRPPPPHPNDERIVPSRPQNPTMPPQRPPPVISNIPPPRPPPKGPLVENLLGLSLDETSAPINVIEVEAISYDNGRKDVDLLSDFTLGSFSTSAPKSGGGVDLLGDPFGIPSGPTLSSSSSFHDIINLKAEKIVKNSSTPNLSDLILGDIIGMQPEKPLEQQPISFKIEEKPKANYSRDFFAEPEKKTDLNAVFGDFLTQQGFAATKNSSTKTMNDLRRVEMAKEMDPTQLKVAVWKEGKKKNIRALLSSLHTIVWPTCHWEETNMSQMVTAAQVKKMYRKACLAIHPDKQMNTEHEELAKIIFVELNEAWAAFESNGQS